MARYRIVRDSFAGFEVQKKVWFWPFWFQAGGVNTFMSVERAERYARNYRNSKVVKYL